tara:strand:- start:6798 stop:7649 length:852 start_codon:yes stop_codon:yes gene_type:complete
MNHPREKDIGPLIALLEDNDQKILDTIVEHIVNIGTTAVPHLKRATITNPALGPRIESVVEEIRINELEKAFLLLPKHGDTMHGLEVGSFLITKLVYPNINVQTYSDKIDEMAKEAREKIARYTSNNDILNAFNHYFFIDQGFHGNTLQYNEVDNSFLHRIIDRRKGIPISLSVLYMLLGSRLDLPLHGVGAPGHFLVKFDARDYRIFIDCFAGGKLLTDKECARFLIRNGYGFKSSYLHRSPVQDIVTRMIKNLISLYQANNQPARVVQLRRFINLVQHHTV